MCALKHYYIRTFVFVLVALLLVKIFDGGFNGLTILNLIPTGTGYIYLELHKCTAGADPGFLKRGVTKQWL